ncbi:hypothetical protein [Oceanibacterium hippocampi]|uniref:Uncharacterized protein n=1 Tax=Oceanibacterium hippocampi TaxID=745714 RepID=A0A1Y5U178_9PROT|nr:hypothetical protein [Oceanibacterium hippocampi]SLN73761.1 hypothetical protein OCH7691_03656 [Oceanibacterium hippocampi]
MRIVARLMSRDILRAYDAGELTEAECEGVEAYLLDHPETRAQIADDRRHAPANSNQRRDNVNNR